MLERYAHPTGAEMSRAVRVLTACTATGTKTGTAPKNRQRTSKKRGRVSVVKSRVAKWRPQRVAPEMYSVHAAAGGVAIAVVGAR
jgi:hypothetical protein